MEELLTKLKAALGDDTKAGEVAEKAKADGATDLATAALLTEADWVGYGIPKVTARKLAKELAEATKPAPAPATTPAALGSVLPALPDDESFLKALQTGGVLKMQPNDVVSAVRAMFASQYGLFDIEDSLTSAMETRAEELDEPLPQVYYDLTKLLARKKHSDVLQALDVPGKIFSEKNKRQFLTRMQGIWSTLSVFQGRIDAWQSAWLAKMSNPAAMMAAFATMGSGGGTGLGLTDAPDTAPIVDAATGVIDALNKIFAGAGIPVARAFAADAVQISEILRRPEVVSATGSGSFEEMVRKLGIGATADTVRTERTVTQYALAVIKLPEVPTPQLPMYIASLKELGATVAWGSLGGRNGAAGRDRTDRRAGDAETFGGKNRTF